MQWFPVQTRRFPLGKRRIPLGIRGSRYRTATTSGASRCRHRKSPHYRRDSPLNRWLPPPAAGRQPRERFPQMPLGYRPLPAINDAYEPRSTAAGGKIAPGASARGERGERGGESDSSAVTRSMGCRWGGKYAFGLTG